MQFGRGNYYRGGYRGGANINLDQLLKSGKTKFQEAVASNNVQSAADYVKREYVNEPFNGYPPILHATVHGNPRMVALLISNGASVKSRYEGRSLAYIAAVNGNPELARRLVANGGGTKSDVSSGSARFAVVDRERREANRKIAAGVAAVLFGGGGSSGGNSSSDDEREANRIRTQMHLYEDANNRRARGEDVKGAY